MNINTKRLVIVNDDALGYGTALLKACRNHGMYTSLISFNERGVLGKLRKTFTQKLFEKMILKKILKIRPTAVLFLCGEINLLEKAIIEIKKNSISAGIWLYDDLYKYNGILEYLKLFDFIISFNSKDVLKIQSTVGGACVHMPLFFDDSIFKKNKIRHPNYELAFIGSIYGTGYRERRDVISRLCRVYKKNEFFLCTGHNYLNLIKIFRDIKVLLPIISHVRFKNLSMWQVSTVYDSTKFVLNINGDQQTVSLPMRIYEALATGAIIVNILGSAKRPVASFKNIVNVSIEDIERLPQILEGFYFEDLDVQEFSSSDRAKSLIKIINQL